MLESLTKSLHSAEFAIDELQQALRKASALESLIILPLIADAVELHNKIDSLISAVQS